MFWYIVVIGVLNRIFESDKVASARKCLKRIYIHGDGALWIKTGQEWLPKSKMVLDKYHLNKAILGATAGQEQHRKPVYTSVYEGDWSGFCELIVELKQAAQTPKKRERINKFKTYIRNNWEAITIYKEEGVNGSCTEEHISHVNPVALAVAPLLLSYNNLTPEGGILAVGITIVVRVPISILLQTSN
jgi:hypothetical protein